MLQVKWLGPSLLSAQSSQLSRTYSRSLRDRALHQHIPTTTTDTQSYVHSQSVLVYVVTFQKVRGAAASACESVEVVEPSSLIDKAIMRMTEIQTNNPA